eukprot:6185979-Pleurochrysis_carterae.AAC.3
MVSNRGLVGSLPETCPPLLSVVELIPFTLHFPHFLPLNGRPSSSWRGFGSTQEVGMPGSSNADRLHANQGPREKQAGSFTAECALICLPKHPFAYMPLTSRDAGQTVFKCPESVPARAAT